MSHQTEDRLECYALGRLPEAQVAVVEEHLLVCAVCQEKLDDVEAFALAMRQAIADVPVAGARIDWFRWLRPAQLALWPRASWSMAPFSMALAGGVAVIALAAGLYLHTTSASLVPLASLQLTAIRGDTPSVLSARETDITLADAPADSSLHVEVVDSTGGTVWSGPLEVGSREVKLARRLPQDSYFIRLYSGAGTLLHEYGFLVRSSR